MPPLPGLPSFRADESGDPPFPGVVTRLGVPLADRGRATGMTSRPWKDEGSRWCKATKSGPAKEAHACMHGVKTTTAARQENARRRGRERERERESGKRMHAGEGGKERERERAARECTQERERHAPKAYVTASFDSSTAPTIKWSMGNLIVKALQT